VVQEYLYLQLPVQCPASSKLNYLLPATGRFYRMGEYYPLPLRLLLWVRRIHGVPRPAVEDPPLPRGGQD
jgi:hypothetical protein